MIFIIYSVEFFENIPECVGRYSHNAFRTLLRRKPRCILQCLVREWSQVKPTLVSVTEPRTTRHCQHLTVNITAITTHNGHSDTAQSFSVCTNYPAITTSAGVHYPTMSQAMAFCTCTQVFSHPWTI